MRLYQYLSGIIYFLALFENITKEYTCQGCKTGNNKKHNGIYCKIMNWDTNRKIKFETLLKKK